MKKVIDIFLIIIIFLIIYFLQVNFFTWFNIGGIMPNIFVIFIMLIGLFLKKDFAFFFGIIFGVLLDIFSGSRIGINTIALSIIGLASGILEKSFSKDNRITVMAMTSVLTFGFELIIYILNIVFLEISNIQLIDFIKIVVVEMIYNDILVIMLYQLFCKFGNKLEQDFIGNKSFLNFF